MIRVLKGLSAITIVVYWIIVIIIISNNNLLRNITIEASDDPFLSIAKTKELSEETLPILQNLVRQKFFRYFRVDIEKPCPMDEINHMCKTKEKCTLKGNIKDNIIPQKWLAEDQREKDKNSLSVIQFYDMMKPHKLEENPKAVWAFDAISENSIYVDLLTDREAFTGYQGGAIWKQIYDDNCWNSFEKCNDNKFLYRMISGMHSSVSSHLSEYYIYEETMEIDANVRVYYEKVGVHPERIKNLLLAVNLMWRALNRFADRINDFEIDTGDLMADVSAKQYLMLLTRVLEPVKDFYFDDSQIFGRVKDHDEQKRLFNKFFTDIIKLMDCVDCVKCKVYGKMQVLGLGTALRILLNDDLKELTRNELVAFVNSLAKWTESVVINRRMRERSYNSMQSSLFQLSVLAVVLLCFLYCFGQLLHDFQLKRGKEKVE